MIFHMSFQNFNGPITNEQIEQDDQLNLIGENHSVAEFANMLPCPIAGCLWYSHSATLYVHLFTVSVFIFILLTIKFVV